MHTLITSADLVTLNPERSSAQAKVHVQDIQNISLSVDNGIGYLKRGFPRFLLSTYATVTTVNITCSSHLPVK